MHPHGSDRLRMAGRKVMLHSAISKGWRPQVAKQGTHAEFPGTAVLWDDQYFEVISVTPGPSGITYVLAPWQDHHVIRVFDSYDAETELRRVAHFNAAKAQRKGSAVASLAGIVLGQLPAAVQKRIANNYGVSPARMTIVSAIPGLVLFGWCVWQSAGAKLGNGTQIPIWLWILAGFLLLESGVRFHIAMSQDRGVGSFCGILGYIVFWTLAPNRAQLVSPFATEKGLSTSFQLAAADDVALRDAITMRAPFFTLLTPEEQQRLAQRFGYDYRSHARGLAILILVCATLGVISSWNKLAGDGGTFVTMSSLVEAGALAIEQLIRLRALRRGPCGSILGAIVRPFLRRYLA